MSSLLQFFVTVLGCFFVFALALCVFLSLVWTKRFLAKSAINDRVKTMDAQSIESNFSALRQEQMSLRGEVSRMNLILAMRRKPNEVISELMPK